VTNGIADKFAYLQPVNEGIAAGLKSPQNNAEWTGGRAQINGFEVFIGTQFGDVISVSAGGNNVFNSTASAMQVFGNDGDDVLFGGQKGGQFFGGDGNDILGTHNPTRMYSAISRISLFDSSIRTLLDGGVGDDLFIAGDSQEDFVGGLGIDTLTYEAGTDFSEGVLALGINLNLATGLGQSGFAEGDTLSGIENVYGSGNNDAITIRCQVGAGMMSSTATTAMTVCRAETATMSCMVAAARTVTTAAPVSTPSPGRNTRPIPKAGKIS
jgi:hypothetical protein